MDGYPILNWTTSVLPKLMLEHINDITRGTATSTINTNSVEVECKDPVKTEDSCDTCVYRYGHSKCGVMDDKYACKTCDAKKQLGKCPCADLSGNQHICRNFEREVKVVNKK